MWIGFVQIRPNQIWTPLPDLDKSYSHLFRGPNLIWPDLDKSGRPPLPDWGLPDLDKSDLDKSVDVNRSRFQLVAVKEPYKRGSLVRTETCKNKGIGTCECFSQTYSHLTSTSTDCEKHSHVPIPLFSDSFTSTDLSVFFTDSFTSDKHIYRVWKTFTCTDSIIFRLIPLYRSFCVFHRLIHIWRSHLQTHSPLPIFTRNKESVVNEFTFTDLYQKHSFTCTDSYRSSPLHIFTRSTSVQKHFS